MTRFHVYKSGSLCPCSVLTLHSIYLLQQTKILSSSAPTTHPQKHSICKHPSYLFSLTGAWWLDVRGDEMWGGEVDCIGIATLWCKSHLLICLFSLHPFFLLPLTTPPSPLCILLLRLCTIFSPSHLSLSVLHSVLSPGGVRAGLLCPLRVRRVFKLYCSWQAWGKPTVVRPAVVDSVRQMNMCGSTKRKLFH